MKKTLQGKELDIRLKEELEKMLADGYNLSPISRSNLQRRLKLQSRGTLAVKYRAELINNAMTLQREQAGITPSGKKKRNSLEEQMDILKQKVAALTTERDGLVERISLIITNCQSRGFDIDDILFSKI